MSLKSLQKIPFETFLFLIFISLKRHQSKQDMQFIWLWLNKISNFSQKCPKNLR